MSKPLTIAEAAAMAGVHRSTLLRWLRERRVPEPIRDRRGRRAFTRDEAAAVAAYAGSGRTAEAARREERAALQRLESIDWDFAAARTGYLTHNLHPYPAKFIPQIPNALIRELSSVGDTVADIFCGSGTTLLEALLMKRNAVGIDANPVAALISRAKTTPLTASDLERLAAHRSACARIRGALPAAGGNLFADERPFRSAGWRPPPRISDFWFEPHVTEELAALRSLIGEVPASPARELCSVAFSSILVSVSKQDSDTRYVRRDKALGSGAALGRYLDRLDAATSAAREMTGLVESHLACEIVESDILDAPDAPPFDLVVTSPPYPNAYSYHLYHRTRLAWLGHDADRFKRIEIGSHRKYSAKGRRRAGPDTFRRELDRIFAWLRTRLRPGRYACFVIGDSTIDGKRIDNAAPIIDAGTAHGFREVGRICRTIAPTRKAFNPRLGGIKTERILILRRA